MSASLSKKTWRDASNAVLHGAWAVVSVMGLASLVLALLLLALMKPLGITEEMLLWPEWVLGMYAAQYAVGLFILLLIPVLVQKKTKRQLKDLFGLLRSPAIKDFGLALLAFVPYFAASTALAIIVAAVVPGFNADQVQDVGFSDINGTTQLIIAGIALVILAPIAEELIFRGYIFGNARAHLGFWPSAILTSVLFGLVHGQWNVGLDTFVLSIALCYLRERTGSIWAGMFLHALKNGLAFTLLFILQVR